MPIALDVSPDYRIMLVALVATMVAATLAGAIPAFRATGASLQSALATTGRTIGNRSDQRITRALVGLQLALSLLLVGGAGLMLRTLVRLSSVDLGFEPENVVVLEVTHEGGRGFFGMEDDTDEANRLAALYSGLENTLSSLPGVRSASLSWLGLFGGNDVGTRVGIVDQDGDNPPSTRVDYVSNRYFETVGMQILRGRGFEVTDSRTGPKVAVVNEAFVRERFRGGDPLGRRLKFVWPPQLAEPFTIVGVVRDSKYNNLREDRTEPMLWTPLVQAPIRISAVTFRVEPGSEATVLRESQRALATVDPDIMVRRQTTLAGQVARTVARERLLLGLAAVYGALAMGLAAIGLYGTLAHAVTRRTREIGVRLALGARSRAVLGQVVGDALRLAVWGVVSGAPLALAAGYALQSFLFGVEPYDLAALGGASIVLTLVAILAAYVPARRASRVNPIEALRYE
jgi:predicted permease